MSAIWRIQFKTVSGILTIVIFIAWTAVGSTKSQIILLAQGAATPQTSVPTPAGTSTPQAVTFPALTGPYTVGRTAYEWIDQSRDEKFASAPGLKRDLMVYIWFPASITKRTKIAPYMDGGPLWDIEFGYHQTNLNGYMAESPEHPGYPGLESLVHSHAYSTSILDPAKPHYPVLIFDQEFAAEISLNYASLIEEIASHGYIVIGITHPYTTPVISYPDGRVVIAGSVGEANRMSPALLATWTQDIQFVLDQAQKLNTTDDSFKGYLDLNHIGVFASNYAGVTSLTITALDPRIVAGAALNLKTENGPIIFSPTSKPFLDIGLSERPDVAKRGPDKYALDVDGIGEMSFSDLGLLAPLVPHPLTDRWFGSIDPARGIQIVSSYLVTFFDHYLNGVTLNWPTYPEAHLQLVGTAAN